MFKKALILSLGLMVLSLNVSFIFSQEETEEEIEEIEWVWGDVVALDENQITVKYLDYETDEEKEIMVVCDLETEFENISLISEIKVGDSVSIDYVVREGKNIAKFISVEKIETLEEEILP